MNQQYKRQLERNIWKVKLNAFLMFFLVYSPILFTSFREKGFSVGQIGTILFVTTIAQLLFTLPTGVLADRWGRARVLAIASLCGVTATLFWLGYSYWYLFLGMLFRCLLDASLSGTDTALLYDTLKELKREQEYTKHNGERFMFTSIGFALASLIASLIPIVPGYKLNFLIASAAFLLSAALSLSMTEPRHHKHQRTSWQHTHAAYKITRTHKEVKPAIGYYVAILGSFVAISTYFQFFLKDVGVQPQHFGFVYAGMALVSAFFAFYAQRIEMYLGERRMIMLIPLSLGVGILGMIIARTPVQFFLALIPVEFAFGSQGAVVNTYIQRHITSAYRSTIESLAALYRATFTGIMLLIMGLLSDAASIQAAGGFLLCVGVFLVVPPIYFMVRTTLPGKAR